MSSCLTVINTRLPPRDGDPSGTSRSSSYNYTGLKPGVNKNAFRKTLWFALVLLTLCLGAAAFLSKRYGLMTGIGFQLGAILSTLGKMLTFQRFGYQGKVLLGLLGQQKIDGSQGGI